MKLTQLGKQRLKDYRAAIQELTPSVDLTKEKKSSPAESSVPKSEEAFVDQARAAYAIATDLAEAWDFTFEASMVKNRSNFAKLYDIVNGGDGSWAVAINSDNGRQLAELTLGLFSDFKVHLHEYVDGLPKDAKDISFGPVTIAYTDPKRILDSAMQQIQGNIDFYDYLQKQQTAKYPESFETAMSTFEQAKTVETFTTVFREASRVPSSFLRLSENQDDTKSFVGIKQASNTGALGFAALVGPLGILKDSFLAGDLQLVDDTHLQPVSAEVQGAIKVNGKRAEGLRKVLKDFRTKAGDYLKGDHAEYKKEIIASIDAQIAEQLNVLISEEKVNIFYNPQYFHCYEACEQLVYYAGKLSTAKRGKDEQLITHLTEKVTGLKNKFEQAFKVYLKTLEGHVSPTKLTELSGLIDTAKGNQNIFAFCNIFLQSVDGTAPNDLIRGHCKAPTLMIHELLKFVALRNREHAEQVREHSHTFRETGDFINDLYSYLLSELKAFTIADDLRTTVLIEKVLRLGGLTLGNFAEAQATEEKKLNGDSPRFGTLVQQRGSSPVHTPEEKEKIVPSDDKKSSAHIAILGSSPQ